MRAVVALLGLLVVMPAHAWGPLGHRISGDIAQRHLTPAAQSAVKQILGAEDLAEASTWADDMRSSPEPFWQKTASPFHYVTIPDGKAYGDVGAPVEGDALTALKQFAATLRDPRARHWRCGSRCIWWPTSSSRCMPAMAWTTVAMT